MHITLGQDPDQVVFIVFNPSNFYLRYFYEINRFHVERAHFRCAMIVNNRLKSNEQDPNSFYAVLFTRVDHVDSNRLIKCIRKADETKWKAIEPEKSTIDRAPTILGESGNIEKKFINAFQIGQDHILLQNWYQTMSVKDMNLKDTQSSPLSSIADNLKGVQCCVTDKSEGAEGYLISF